MATWRGDGSVCLARRSSILFVRDSSHRDMVVLKEGQKKMYGRDRDMRDEWEGEKTAHVFLITSIGFLSNRFFWIWWASNNGLHVIDSSLVTENRALGIEWAAGLLGTEN